MHIRQIVLTPLVLFQQWYFTQKHGHCPRQDSRVQRHARLWWAIFFALETGYPSAENPKVSEDPSVEPEVGQNTGLHASSILTEGIFFFFFLFHLASLFPVLIKQCGIYSAQCLRFLHVILMMFVSPRYDLYSGLVIKCQITNQPFYFAEVSHHPGADPVPNTVWCQVLPIRMCTACWSSTPPWCWPSTQ